MKLLPVIPEFMATASLLSEVRRITRGSRISQLANSEDFCNIVRAFVIQTKQRAPSIWSKRKAGSANPLLADLSELIVDVDTPDGKTLAIDDPALIDMLRAEIDQKHQLTLMQSHRAMTDCRPVSIFSLQSARQLSEETGTPVDKRRFRANVYVDLASANGFAENELVGRSLRIGPKAVITILERDPRCVMITLDPDTGEQAPAILKKVAQAHDGMAGVYGAVLDEGLLHKGDSVEIID